LFFLQDQKEPKNLGLLKMAKNKRAILAGRNEVEPFYLFFIPLYTNHLSFSTHYRLHFFFICPLLVFLRHF